MQHHRSLTTLLAIALTTLLTMPAQSQEASRYERLIASPGTAKTVKSFGLGMLAMPDSRDILEPRFTEIWWANNPDVDMNLAQREISLAQFSAQIDAIVDAVGRHKIERLELAGWSSVGTVRNMDLYYAADTPSGPVMFRVTMAMSEGESPWLHGIEVFEGFEESREATRQIMYHPTKRVASMRKPEPKEQPEDGADGEEEPEEEIDVEEVSDAAPSQERGGESAS